MYEPENWLDLSSYPDPSLHNVPNSIWCWEFMRRNPRFQRDFEEYARKHEMLLNVLASVDHGKNYWMAEAMYLGLPEAERRNLERVFRKWSIAFTEMATNAPWLDRLSSGQSGTAT